MAKETLKDHYQRKYALEGDASAIQTVRSVGTPASRFEAVVQFFPRYFEGGAVLELGAGGGEVAKTLLAAHPHITSYTLGDISLPRVEGVRRNLKDSRVSVCELDAENVASGEVGRYDAIIMVALIEHLVDPLGSMQRINQLLKPNGFVYIDTPNMAKYTRRLKLLLGRFPSTASTNEGLTTYAGAPADLYDEGHLHYFTYRSLSLMLTRRCGFSRVVKLGYPAGDLPLGRRAHHLLARFWPELFSELAVIAYA